MRGILDFWRRASSGVGGALDLRAAIKRRGGESAQARVETLISNLESFLVENPLANAMYGTILGSHEPGLAKSISEPLPEGCSPEGFERLVRSKLKYIPNWKGNPEKVLGVIAQAAKEWALVEVEFRDHSREKCQPTPGSSFKRKARKSDGKQDDEWPKTPITYF